MRPALPERQVEALGQDQEQGAPGDGAASGAEFGEEKRAKQHASNEHLISLVTREKRPSRRLAS